MLHANRLYLLTSQLIVTACLLLLLSGTSSHSVALAANAQTAQATPAASSPSAPHPVYLPLLANSVSDAVWSDTIQTPTTVFIDPYSRKVKVNYISDSKRDDQRPAGKAAAMASGFQCPPADLADFPLGVSNTAIDPIFCSYPSFPGQNPNEFYCTYSATTGVLVESHDGLGLCPANAIGTPPAPEIVVEGNSVVIANGDGLPSPNDDTNFGTVASSSSVAHTFTISNTGDANLTVDTVTLDGAHASDFSVTAQPASPVASGGSTTFQITFTPSAAGVLTATVSIPNDDSDENPYTFAIQGTGAAIVNGSVTQGTPTTSNNPTPQLCAATGIPLAIYTINSPLTNSSANTFTDLFFRVKVLEYTTSNGQQPSLCNATAVVDNGGGGSILAVPNSSLPGGNSQFNPSEILSQAFEVGRPVAAQFRLKVDLFSSTAAAASEGSASEEYLGSFEYVFDDTSTDEFTPVQQIFLPLVNR